MRLKRHIAQMSFKESYGSYEIALVQCENVFNSTRNYSSDIAKKCLDIIPYFGFNDITYSSEWGKQEVGYVTQNYPRTSFTYRTVDTRGGVVDTAEVDIQYAQGVGLSSLGDSLPSPLNTLLSTPIDPLRLFFIRGTVVNLTPVSGGGDLFYQTVIRDPNGRILISMMNAGETTLSVFIDLNFDSLGLSGRGSIKIIGYDQAGQKYNLGISDDSIDSSQLQFLSKEYKAIVLEPTLIEQSFTTSDCRHILESISSFWGTHFKDRELLKQLWSAYNDVIANLYLDLYQRDLSKSLALVPVDTAEINQAFVFNENNLASSSSATGTSGGTSSGISYYISSEIVSIPELYEKYNRTGTVLYENVDYSISDGVITFFSDPSLRLSSPNTAENFVLIGSRIKLSQEIVKRNFGAPVGLDLANTEASKTATQAIHSAYWVGATILNIRLGAQALLQLPLIPIGSEVTSVYSGPENYTIFYKNEFDEKKRVIVDNDVAPSSDNTIKVVTEDDVEHEISNPSDLVGIGKLKTFVTLSPFVEAYDLYSNRDRVMEFSQGLGSEAWAIFHTFFVAFNVNFYAKHVRYLIDTGVIDKPNDMFALMDDFLTRIKPVYTDYIYTFRVAESDTIAVTEEEPELTVDLDLTQTTQFNYSRYYGKTLSTSVDKPSFVIAPQNDSSFGVGDAKAFDISGKDHHIKHPRAGSSIIISPTVGDSTLNGYARPLNAVGVNEEVTLDFESQSFTVGGYIGYYSPSSPTLDVAGLSPILSTFGPDADKSRWAIYINHAAASSQIDIFFATMENSPTPNGGLVRKFLPTSTPLFKVDSGGATTKVGPFIAATFDAGRRLKQIWVSSTSGVVQDTSTQYYGIPTKASTGKDPYNLALGTDLLVALTPFIFTTVYFRDLFYFPRVLSTSELSDLADSGPGRISTKYLLKAENSIQYISSVYPTEEERDRYSLQFDTHDELHGKISSTVPNKTFVCFNFDEDRDPGLYDEAKESFVRAFRSTHPGREVIWKMDPKAESNELIVRNESYPDDVSSSARLTFFQNTYGPLISSLVRRWGERCIHADPTGLDFFEVVSALPNDRVSLIRETGMNQDEVSSVSFGAWIKPDGGGTVFELAGLPIVGSPGSPVFSPSPSPGGVSPTPIITPPVSSITAIRVSGRNVEGTPPLIIRIVTPGSGVSDPRSNVTVEGTYFTDGGVNNVSRVQLRFVNVVPVTSIQVAGFTVLSSTQMRFIVPDMPNIPGITWSRTSNGQRTVDIVVSNQYGSSVLSQRLLINVAQQIGGQNPFIEPPTIVSISPVSTVPVRPPSTVPVYSIIGSNFYDRFGRRGIQSLSIIFIDPVNNASVVVPINIFNVSSATALTWSPPDIRPYFTGGVPEDIVIAAKLRVATETGGSYTTSSGFISLVTPSSPLPVPIIPRIVLNNIDGSSIVPVASSWTRAIVGSGFRKQDGSSNVSNVLCEFQSFRNNTVTVNATSFTVINGNRISVTFPAVDSLFEGVFPLNTFVDAKIIVSNSIGQDTTSNIGFLRFTGGSISAIGIGGVGIEGPGPQPEPDVVISGITPSTWTDRGVQLTVSGNHFLSSRGDPKIYSVTYQLFNSDQTLFFRIDIFNVLVLSNIEATVQIPNLYNFRSQFRNGAIKVASLVFDCYGLSTTLNDIPVVGTDNSIAPQPILKDIPNSNTYGVDTVQSPGVSPLVISASATDSFRLTTSLLGGYPEVLGDVDRFLDNLSTSRGSLLESDRKRETVKKTNRSSSATNTLANEFTDADGIFRRVSDDSSAEVIGRPLIDSDQNKKVDHLSNSKYASDAIRGNNKDAVDALSIPVVPQGGSLPTPGIDSVVSGSVTFEGGNLVSFSSRNLFDADRLAGVKSIYIKCFSNIDSTLSYTYPVNYYSIAKDGSSLDILTPDVREAIFAIGPEYFKAILYVTTSWHDVRFNLEYPSTLSAYPTDIEVSRSRIIRENGINGQAPILPRIVGLSVLRSQFGGGGSIYLYGSGFMDGNGTDLVISVQAVVREGAALVPITCTTFSVVSASVIVAKIPDIRPLVVESIGKESPTTWVILTENGIGKSPEDIFKFIGTVASEMDDITHPTRIDSVNPSQIEVSVDDVNPIHLEFSGANFVDRETGNSRISYATVEFYGSASNDPVSVAIKAGEKWSDEVNNVFNGADARYIGGSTLIADVYDYVDLKVKSASIFGNRTPIKVAIPLNIVRVEDGKVSAYIDNFPEFISKSGIPVDFDLRIVTLDNRHYISRDCLRIVCPEDEKITSTGQDIQLISRVASTKSPILVDMQPLTLTTSGDSPIILPGLLSTKEIYVTSLAKVGHDCGVPIYRLIGDQFPQKDSCLVKLVNVNDRSDQIYCPILWVRNGTVRSFTDDPQDPSFGRSYDELLFVPGYGMDYSELDGKKYYIHIENLETSYPSIQFADTTEGSVLITFTDTTAEDFVVPDPEINNVYNSEELNGTTARWEVYPFYAKVGNPAHRVKIVGKNLCGTANTSDGRTKLLGEAPPSVSLVNGTESVSGVVLFASPDLIYVEFDLSESVSSGSYDLSVTTSWMLADNVTQDVTATFEHAVELRDPVVYSSGETVILPEIIDISGVVQPESYEPDLHGVTPLSLLVAHTEGYYTMRSALIPGISSVFKGPTDSDASLSLKVCHHGNEFATSNTPNSGLGIVDIGHETITDFFRIMPWREIRPVSYVGSVYFNAVPFRTQNVFSSVLDDGVNIPKGSSAGYDGSRSEAFHRFSFDLTIDAAEIPAASNADRDGSWKNAVIKYFYREDPIVDSVFPRNRSAFVGGSVGHPYSEYSNQFFVYGRNLNRTADGWGADLTAVRFSSINGASIPFFRGPDLNGSYLIDGAVAPYGVAVVRLDTNGESVWSYLDNKGISGYATVSIEKKALTNSFYGTIPYYGDKYGAWRYSWSEEDSGIDDLVGISAQSQPMPPAFSLKMEANSTIQYRLRTIRNSSTGKEYIAVAVNIDGDLYEVAISDAIDPANGDWSMVCATVSKVSDTSAKIVILGAEDSARNSFASFADVTEVYGQTLITTRSLHGLKVLAEVIVPYKFGLASNLLLTSIDERMTVGRRPHPEVGKKLFSVNSVNEGLGDLAEDPFNGDIDEVKIVVGIPLNPNYWSSEWNARQSASASLWGQYLTTYGVPSAGKFGAQKLIGTSSGLKPGGIYVGDNSVYECRDYLAIDALVAFNEIGVASGTKYPIVSKYDEILGGFKLYIEFLAGTWYARFYSVSNTGTVTSTSVDISALVISFDPNIAYLITAGIDIPNSQMGISVYHMSNLDGTASYDYQRIVDRENLTIPISMTALADAPGQNLQPLSIGSEVKYCFMPPRRSDYTLDSEYPTRQALYRFNFDTETDEIRYGKQVYLVKNEMIDGDHVRISDPSNKRVTVDRLWGNSSFYVPSGSVFGVSDPGSGTTAYVPGSEYNSVDGLSKFTIAGWFSLAALPVNNGDEMYVVHRMPSSIASSATAGVTRLFQAVASAGEEGFVVSIRKTGGASAIEFRWVDSQGNAFSYRLQGGSYSLSTNTWYGFMFSIDYETGDVAGVCAPYASTTSSSINTYHSSDALPYTGETMVSSDTVQENLVFGGSGSHLFNGFLSEQYIQYGASAISTADLKKVSLGAKVTGVINMPAAIIDNVRISRRKPFQSDADALENGVFPSTVPWSPKKPFVALDNENLAMMEAISMQQDLGSDSLLNGSQPLWQGPPIPDELNSGG